MAAKTDAKEAPAAQLRRMVAEAKLDPEKVSEYLANVLVGQLETITDNEALEVIATFDALQKAAK